MKVSLILACAGSGSRAGFSKNKLLVKTGGTTVLQKTLSAFYKTGFIDEYIVVLSKEDFNEVSPLPDGVISVLGGKTRTESVKNALSLVTGDVVLIHDGARPFVSEKIIKECIETAVKTGSAIPVIQEKNTVCRVKDGKIEKYLGKDGIFAVHTPQGFNAENLKKAYDNIGDRVFNDDGEVYSFTFGEVSVYESSAKNVKLTYAEDFESLSSAPICKVGVGFDCHKLVEGRKLILGGVEIPHDKGLLGHSDADVLTHAIMDSMLSACSLRDIGYHFPDTNEKYKGANSITLLEKVISLCKEKGYKIKSLSAVIMAEKPKLLPHVHEMTESLAKALNIEKENIGISATTLEGLGFIGREEGICVHANSVMVKI